MQPISLILAVLMALAAVYFALIVRNAFRDGEIARFTGSASFAFIEDWQKPVAICVPSLLFWASSQNRQRESTQTKRIGEGARQPVFASLNGGGNGTPQQRKMSNSAEKLSNRRIVKT